MPSTEGTVESQRLSEARTWRHEVAKSVARSLFIVAAVAVPFLLLVVDAELRRRAVIATLLVAGAMLVLCCAKLAEGWLSRLIVAVMLCATLYFYAITGFMAGPALLLVIAVVISGLLLGRAPMFVVAAAAGLGVSWVGWAMVNGAIPAPAPTDVSVLSGRAWLRTTAITLVLTAAFANLVVHVVTRIELSLKEAREQTALREEAERARARTEIAAIQAQKLEAIGRLAAGVAHDFNNNLAAIMGSAELLTLTLPSDPGATALLNEIIEASQRSTELTQQLLAYSRHAQSKPAPTNLESVLQSALAMFRRVCGPGIDVKADFYPEKLVVKADVSLLQSSLLNLLINSRDAMPEGGQVLVSTRLVTATAETLKATAFTASAELAPGRYAELEVKDTGHGMTKAVMARIFEPFFTTKPVGRGTGLGLAAVIGTVHMHGGSIDVESEVGRGTRFRILLPLVDEDSAKMLVGEEFVRGSGRVLVVDDEPKVRSVAAAALRSMGYEVTEAEDGIEAVAILTRDPRAFALVLLDLTMPKLSGRETFDSLRKLAPGLPVLLCSGSGHDEHSDAVLATGASGFVHKPYRLADLSQRVAKAIGAARGGAG